MISVFNNFIIHGEEREYKVKSIRGTLLKFTDIGIRRLEEWMVASTQRKETTCPFDIECKICDKLFGIQFSVEPECPCTSFGVDNCMKVVEKIIRFNGEKGG